MKPPEHPQEVHTLRRRRFSMRRVNKQIDGMYTLATLDQFREDLEQASHLRNLI